MPLVISAVLSTSKRFQLTSVNDSESMAGDRWEQVMNVIVGVAELAAKYDEDGVDVYFLNSKRVGKELHVSYGTKQVNVYRNLS